jgi:hypothetical protein
MKLSLLSGRFIKTQLLIVCGRAAVDFRQWLKGGRAKDLRFKILGHDTEFTQLAELSVSDVQALLWMRFQKLRFRR